MLHAKSISKKKCAATNSSTDSTRTHSHEQLFRTDENFPAITLKVIRYLENICRAKSLGTIALFVCMILHRAAPSNRHTARVFARMNVRTYTLTRLRHVEGHFMGATRSWCSNSELVEKHMHYIYWICIYSYTRIYTIYTQLIVPAPENFM